MESGNDFSKFVKMERIENQVYPLRQFTGNSPVYRISLGPDMPESDRVTFPSEYGLNNTGSIGFIDLRREAECIPSESEGRERIDALLLLRIGIEPDYQSNGYAKKLVGRAQDLAVAWGVEGVVTPQITNDKMRSLLEKLDYTIYSQGLKAFKLV